jgi:hypothetical protein
MVKIIITRSSFNNFNVNNNYNTINCVFNKKYTVLQDLIYEVYDVKLDNISYVDNFMLMKILMNTIVYKRKINQENKYNELKNLISHMYDVPHYSIYKLYDINLNNIIENEFCILNDDEHEISDINIDYNVKYEKVEKRKKYITMFTIMFLIIYVLVLEYLFQIKFIQIKDPVNYDNIVKLYNNISKYAYNNVVVPLVLLKDDIINNNNIY